MMTEAAMFGRPDRFGISVRWVKDSAPPNRRPADYGWSMGHIAITVAGVNLTGVRVGGEREGYVGWYLGPLLHWLARNWAPLIHEERFGWPDRSAAPAAMACRRALNRYRGSDEGEDRRLYRSTQAWGARHGIRWAAAGGLFPDLFLRRLVDDIELSWTAEPPPYAPTDFAFESGAGVATLPVEDVAGPLWDLLRWACANPPRLQDTFRRDWEALCSEVDAVRHVGARDLEAEAISRDLLDRVQRSFAEVDRADLVISDTSPERPYLAVLPLAVAMYGGLAPTLDDADIATLRDDVLSALERKEAKALQELVRDRDGRILSRVPHEDGLAFASELFEDLEDLSQEYSEEGRVDVVKICRALGIVIEAKRLVTSSIRGVALAGENLGPKIVVNLTNSFNATQAGQRFTVAHELCHVLFDRSRARRIAHSSGPWATPGIEKRANAFAAYLLMPPYLVRRYLPAPDKIDHDAVRSAATKLDVSASALLEHLFNIGVIDEDQKESLGQFSPRQFLVRRKGARRSN